MSKEKQIDEINRPMNEELFNNLEKQYQEVFKVKAESEQIEEMTPLDILANDINQHCPDLAENYCGDTHCVACLANALYNAGYRKQSENIVEIVRCRDCQFAYIDGDRVYCRNTETPWYNDYFEVFTEMSDFCSYGAKMKGGAEE